MEITEVKVFVLNEDKLKAFVSVVLDRCFMINDIKVIQGRDGLFISMPSRRKKNGDFKDVAHPLNNETRQWMEARILETYRSELKAAQCGSASAVRGRRHAVAGPSQLEEPEVKPAQDAVWTAV